MGKFAKSFNNGLSSVKLTYPLTRLLVTPFTNNYGINSELSP